MRVGARAEIVSDLTQLEDELGSLEREMILDDNKTERLYEARIRHAELLEYLRVVDYRSYTQKMHVEADKPGALLAKLIGPQQSPTPILMIQSPQLGFLTSQTSINEAFRLYYVDLYAAPPPVD
ncbi:hypothetical protein NDU88_007123 [Pleurodeles waltl]|uniref:Uncharacterized protein n=1 Tax=Pleurodeles waltl TaxID=8319 RepID=A0AAV7RNI1_PLEWA|nr:hypothetical protein NDU88_007123 [Pleurodeles waltl]